MNIEMDIVSKEIVEEQIKGLQALIKMADNNINSYLDTLNMFIKADGVFKEDDFKWIKGLLEDAQAHKERLLAEIEVKKSVITFL